MIRLCSDEISKNKLRHWPLLSSKTYYRRFLGIYNNFQERITGVIEGRRTNVRNIRPNEEEKLRIKYKNIFKSKSNLEHKNPAKELQLYINKLQFCKTKDEIWNLINEMKLRKVSLEHSFFMNIIDIAAKWRDVHMCGDILYWHRQSGLASNVILYGAALKVAHRAQNLPFAQHVWTQMRADGLQPHIIQYGAMLATISELPKRELANGFPETRVTLTKAYLREMKLQGIKCNIIIYTSVLNVLSKAGLYDEASGLIQEMESESVELNEFGYDCLINASCLGGNYEQALKYFEIAKAKSKVNIVIYTSVMKALLENKNYKGVDAIWREIPNVGLKRDYVILSLYGKSLATQCRVREIWEALNVGVEPNSVFWTNVIHCLYVHGDISNALVFFQEGYQRGKVPVWHADQENVLDLHTHTSGVACVAVRHFIKLQVENGSKANLGIIVGRGKNSNTSTQTLVASAVEELLNVLNIPYTVGAKGGFLNISGFHISNAKI